MRVFTDKIWSPVPAAQQRVVLAVLLIEAGRVVTSDRLIHEIWGDSRPRAANAVIRGYVMRLRRRLGPQGDRALVTRDTGWELIVDRDDVDTGSFDDSVAAGRRALARGDLAGAEDLLSQALGHWRGSALEDVPRAPTVVAFASLLEQVRLMVAEERIGVRLALGRHTDVLGELQQLLKDHPLNERLWADLMVALCRAGRRAEALTAFQRARQALITELDLEPGERLVDLRQAILSNRPLS
ncbi:AfsR/SARP family transcriptional regulator [Actinomycetes bacterium KLBMP 9797]